LVPVPYKPANPELAWMVAIFWIAWKPRLEVGPAPGIPGVPNGAFEDLIEAPHLTRTKPRSSAPLCLMLYA
jgi:hypothetical protein